MSISSLGMTAWGFASSNFGNYYNMSLGISFLILSLFFYILAYIINKGGTKMNITFAGNPLTLSGNLLQVGDKAPSFTVLSNDLQSKTLEDFSGIKVISVVPSLDTGVCDFQTRKFNEELSDVDGVTLLTISADLPFAQGRWCGNANLENAVTLSDHYSTDFGLKYGLLIKELRLLSRAVLVLDDDNEVIYTDYLSEITEHPNYDAVKEFVLSK